MDSDTIVRMGGTPEQHVTKPSSRIRWHGRGHMYYTAYDILLENGYPSTSQDGVSRSDRPAESAQAGARIPRVSGQARARSPQPPRHDAKDGRPRSRCKR